MLTDFGSFVAHRFCVGARFLVIDFVFGIVFRSPILVLRSFVAHRFWFWSSILVLVIDFGFGKRFCVWDSFLVTDFGFGIVF